MALRPITSVGQWVLPSCCNTPPNIRDKILAEFHGYADQLVELGQADDDGGGVAEANDYRMREQVDDHAQLEHAQAKLDGAHHKGQ